MSNMPEIFLIDPRDMTVTQITAGNEELNQKICNDLKSGRAKALNLSNGDRVVALTEMFVDKGKPLTKPQEIAADAVGSFAVLDRPYKGEGEKISARTTPEQFAKFASEGEAGGFYNEGSENVNVIIGQALIFGPANPADPFALTSATSDQDYLSRMLCWSSTPFEAFINMKGSYQADVTDEMLLECGCERCLAEYRERQSKSSTVH